MIRPMSGAQRSSAREPVVKFYTVMKTEDRKTFIGSTLLTRMLMSDLFALANLLVNRHFDKIGIPEVLSGVEFRGCQFTDCGKRSN